MKTVVKPCICKHAGQDALHGSGKRVMNEKVSKGTKTEYRCTVCGALRGGE